jgi:transcriptional regulator with XRE-family HTH domain
VANEEAEGLVGLREARERAGIGRSRFARLAGFGEGDIYRYETGRKRPTYKTAMRLASALNIGIEEIAEFAPALQEEEVRRVEEFVRELRERLSLMGGDQGVFVAIGDVPETLRGEFERFARENPDCVRWLGAETETMNCKKAGE